MPAHQSPVLVGRRSQARWSHPTNLSLTLFVKWTMWGMFALGKDAAVGNLSLCIEELAAKQVATYSLGDIRLRAYEGVKRIAACEAV